jgi:2-dehydropantoate 2-reductase
MMPHKFANPRMATRNTKTAKAANPAESLCSLRSLWPKHPPPFLSRFMKIAVVGAGAVGAWYAAKLALAGHETHFVLRSDFDAVRASGYTLRDHAGEQHLYPVNAHRDAATVGTCDLVIIGLKATANDKFAPLLTPLVGPNTTLLTLQNGMGNAEALGEIFGIQKVMAGLCFVCLNRTRPGVIENYHHGRVAFGEGVGSARERTHAVAGAFVKAGVVVEVAESLEEILWKKLCWNVPFNGLAIAAGGITTDKILASPELTATAGALMREIQTAALARGFKIPDSFLEHQFKVTREMDAYKPSSLIDFLAGRPVEVDAIWGYPLRRALAAGVPMPELTKLHAKLLATCLVK